MIKIRPWAILSNYLYQITAIPPEHSLQIVTIITIHSKIKFKAKFYPRLKPYTVNGAI